ncbi:hypothetical protein DM01DRAFT_1337216 [Hesseltinella vesiculosa]|uniref:AMP-binding enzyme C-terminal domain-containing protein n=1 Tax=Hesseltinella vesiculosa TaxID=101127 RepID=A0A1X2GE96_9FUNG|nr:hypothetical protein DM01DRAFT_1337216 [Hesseltinella vesiculosa]
MGVGRGDQVCFYAPNSIYSCASYFGSLLTGAEVFPLSAYAQPHEVAVRRLGTLTNIKLVLSHPDALDLLVPRCQQLGIQNVYAMLPDPHHRTSWWGHVLAHPLDLPLTSPALAAFGDSYLLMNPMHYTNYGLHGHHQHLLNVYDLIREYPSFSRHDVVNSFKVDEYQCSQLALGRDSLNLALLSNGIHGLHGYHHNFLKNATACHEAYTELESTFKACPLTKDAAVIGVYDDTKKAVMPVVFAAPLEKDEDGQLASRILAWVNEHVPDASKKMMTGFILFTPAIPRSPITGEVLRYDLLAMYRSYQHGHHLRAKL